MIELKGITKRYGGVEAIRDISFTAPAGQVVGLLGQNGAGKTTTLNILTGYMPPSAGQVLVNGLDMLTNSRECKRAIGYLPEKPPLYDEMTVRGFLIFVCELKEVAHKAIPGHVAEIMQLCGLTEVAGRVIGHLSKGYRQRVGMAQALCGDPPVLVLDEPTVGLDPRQVVEIRELMKRLGRSHTVIFSSHLLSEIQQLCQRVIILHQGKLIREADMAELTDAGDVLRLRAAIQGRAQTLLPAIRSLACVQRVKQLRSGEEGVLLVEMECRRDASPDAQTALFRLLCAMDAPIRELMPVRDSLEDVFLRATSAE